MKKMRSAGDSRSRVMCYRKDAERSRMLPAPVAWGDCTSESRGHLSVSSSVKLHLAVHRRCKLESRDRMEQAGVTMCAPETVFPVLLSWVSQCEKLQFNSGQHKIFFGSRVSGLV